MIKNTISKFFIASPKNGYKPAILSYQAFLIYGLILLLLRLLLTSLPAGGSAIDSQILMNLINQERSQRNLVTLTTDQRLITAADSKTQDMINRGYFAHIDPDGNYVWNRIIKAGYSPYILLGENLAIDFSTSEGMIKAWIDSPSHRANILQTDFRDQGLAASYGNYQGRYTNLTTSLFGTLDNATREIPKTTPPVKITTPPPPSNPVVESENTTPPPEKQITPITPSSTLPIQDTIITPTTTAIDQIINTINNIPATTANLPSPWTPLQVSRIIFTIFGLMLLSVLTADTVIIIKHEAEIIRSRPSYHLFTFILIALISILIWWW